MSQELSIYTGTLEYKNIVFAFVFDGDGLRLIPPKEKEWEIQTSWLMTPIGNGVYSAGEPLKMEEEYLVGKCNENSKTLIFITRLGESIGSYNSVLRVKVLAYIEGYLNENSIDRISFSSPEINRIHPVNKAYNHSFNINDFSEKGVFSVTTTDFDSTSTKAQIFNVDGIDIAVNFSTTRHMSNRIDEAPLSVTSVMLFEFAPTTDYTFIFKLWHIAKQFIQFLCYRKNVFLPTIELSSPYKEGQHKKIAVLHILNEKEILESNILKQGRCIKQQYIEGYEGLILKDIADNMIYLRHIPNTYKSGRTIDASRFIMITAAFEWEFRRMYPNGVPKKEATLRVEEEATKSIQELIDSSSGKLKSKYKFLKKLIKSDSLENEIIKIGEDIDDTVGNFGKHLYNINDESLVYKDMGKRLADQRNHFAHGDLDKDFIGLSLLDLMYMEYIVYAMQLRFYGVNDENIRKAINDLFHLNFAL